MQEIWKDVVGYENYYEVSNRGRVRNRKTGRILKQSGVGKNRLYRQVNLNGKFYYVHRIEYEAFYGPIPEGMVINHIDENPANNGLDNLMLCTQSDNLRWKSAQERRLNSYTGKRRPREVIQMTTNHEVIQSFKSSRIAEKETGIPHASIWACCYGIQKTTKLKSGEQFIWKYAE